MEDHTGPRSDNFCHFPLQKIVQRGIKEAG